jgi:hypothetical protein
MKYIKSASSFVGSFNETSEKVKTLSNREMYLIKRGVHLHTENIDIIIDMYLLASNVIN